MTKEEMICTGVLFVVFIIIAINIVLNEMKTKRSIRTMLAKKSSDTETEDTEKCSCGGDLYGNLPRGYPPMCYDCYARLKDRS